MKRLEQLLSVLVFVVFGSAITWIVFHALVEDSFSKDEGYELVARFNDLGRLQVGDDVRMGGVRVGVVESTGLISGVPTATLLIDDDYMVPENSVASINMVGLLGGSYVSLTLGSPGMPAMAANTEIRTRPTTDINKVIADLGSLGDRLDNLLGGIDGGAGGGGASTFFEKLNGLLDTNAGNITETLENFKVASSNLREGKGTLGKLMSSDEAYDRLMDVATDFEQTFGSAQAFFDDAGSLIDHVKSGEGTLGQLLYGDRISNQLENAIANLNEFTTRLNSGDGTLGKLVNDDSLYHELEAVMHKAQQTLDSVSDTGPITAVGVAATALF